MFTDMEAIGIISMYKRNQHHFDHYDDINCYFLSVALFLVTFFHYFFLLLFSYIHINHLPVLPASEGNY